MNRSSGVALWLTMIAEEGEKTVYARMTAVLPLIGTYERTVIVPSIERSRGWIINHGKVLNIRQNWLENSHRDYLSE